MKPTAGASSKLIALIGLFAALAFPAAASGAVTITEVMYDAPGSDSGHEWIEISNDGSVAVNLSGYKLSEGGTNHAVSVAAGTSTLAAGEVAVLSNNPQTFLRDFPNYTGTLFKSSFSLSNTGESITLKDTKLAEVSSVTYSAVEGAGGDGNSLHLSGAQWTPGAPNPGSLAPTQALVKAAPAPAAKKISGAKSSASKTSGASSNLSQNAAVEASGAASPIAALPHTDMLWSTVLGLGALIVVGVGGALYVRRLAPAPAASQEHTPTADEFEITP